MGKPKRHAKPKPAPKPKRPKAGRPPFDWTAELVHALCGAISEGNGIINIAGQLGFPDARTIYRKMAVDAEFAAAIARAREAQQEFEADNCIAMADKATEKNWQVVKLRIWARQWRAGKLAPKKFGDKTAIELRTIRSIEDLTDEELTALATVKKQERA